MKFKFVYTMVTVCTVACALSGCSKGSSIGGVIVQKTLEKADDEVIGKLKNNDVFQAGSKLIGVDLDKLASDGERETEAESESDQELEESESSEENEKAEGEQTWEVLYSYGEEAFEPKEGLMDFGFCQIDIPPYWSYNAYVSVNPESPEITFYTQKGYEAGYGRISNIFIAKDGAVSNVVYPYILGACNEGIIMACGTECAPYPMDDDMQKSIFDNMEKELPVLYNSVITPNVLPDDWDEQLLKMEHEAGYTDVTLEEIRRIPVLPKVLPEGWDKPCNAVDPFNGRELFEPVTYDNSPFFGTWILSYQDYSTWTDASREENHCSGQVEPWLVFCRDGRLIWNAYGDYKEGTYKICSPGSEEEEAIGYIDGRTLNIGVYQGGMWVAGMPEIEKTEYSGEKVKTDVWTFEYRTSEELTEEQGL